MEDGDLTNNPFVGLFKNVETAKSYAEGIKFGLQQSSIGSSRNVDVNDEDDCSSMDLEEEEDTINVEDTPQSLNKPTFNFNKEITINDFLQRIFLVTIEYEQRKSGAFQFDALPYASVKLDELREECESSSKPCFLSGANISQAIYERLQIVEPNKSVFVRSSYSGNLNLDSASDVKLIRYLSACYCRILEEISSSDHFFLTPAGKSILEKNPEIINELHKLGEDCKKLVVSFTGTILLQPEIFPVNEPSVQFLNVLKSAYVEPRLYEYFERLVQLHTDADELTNIFTPVLDHIWKLSEKLSIMHPDVFPLLNTMIIISRCPMLAIWFTKTKYWLPSTPRLENGRIVFVDGSAFEHNTLLGRFLRITSIPAIGTLSEHFMKPSQQSEAEMNAITNNIRQYIDTLVNMVHNFLHNLLQIPNMQHDVLLWIGLCLFSNEKRSQMYADPTVVADSGFFLNLTHVLLKFCAPFCTPDSKLLLKVDCCYGSVLTTPLSIMKSDTPIHTVGLDKYTPMAPEPDEESQIKIPKKKFNFISEIFFLTHLCFKLGYVKMYDQYEELMKRLRKLSNIYQDAQRQGNIQEMIENYRNDFENGIRTQLAAKAHLLNPSLSELSLKFSISSGHWLLQQVLAGINHTIPEHRELKAELLTSKIPPALTVIPEFVAENVGDAVRSLGNFNEESLERCDQLKYLMNFFAVFLGAKCYIKNPHLRAKLAECLAAFLPKEKSGLSQVNTFSFSFRKRAFESSSVMVKILPQSLLQLFVDIEFTGHTMEFDQKFMYRRYMYAILEYTWKMPSYLVAFKDLHKRGLQMYKEEKFLSTFPRFINLLVNDSTFLLDEALQNLVTIKELEKEKANGEWNELSAQEKMDKEKNLTQCGHMAEGYNTMARETVHVISYITKEIDRPFVSHVMADSMAAFLNYFFVHLVGPKRKLLKVSDFEKYNFDPGNLVKNITRIYLQLTQNDDFCEAIVKDSRSYSPALFTSAVEVLERLEGAHDLAGELKTLNVQLEEVCEKKLKAESEMPEPPEEFLDPISCELMQEPVQLPSSGQIICRSTIAKHLLSDEKDPFNRSPLRLDQVVPCEELQERIQLWMKENLVQPPSFKSD